MIEPSPFRESDRSDVLRLLKPSSAEIADESERWQHADAAADPKIVQSRLVLGRPAVGYINMLDRNTTGFRHPGLLSCELAATDWQAAEPLLREAETFAIERDCRTLRIDIDQTRFGFLIPDLEKIGFEATGVKRMACVDLLAFDLSDAMPFIGRAERQGIVVREIDDVPALLDLLEALDEPTMAADWSDRLVADDDVALTAWIDSRLVGFHHVALKPIPWIHYSGTHPNYRNQGVAGALKAVAMLEARRRGADRLHTSNSPNNGPAVALNDRLGFVEHQRLVKLCCRLESDRAVSAPVLAGCA